MKISDVGTKNQNFKICQVVVKTTISAIVENKSKYEISKMKNGEIIINLLRRETQM